MAGSSLQPEDHEPDRVLPLSWTLSVNAELLSYSAQSFGRGLNELAKRQHSDLLVIGSSRRGLVGRVLMGDQTRAFLTGAPCAVAIAPSGYAVNSQTLANLDAGCDRSTESERALTGGKVVFDEPWPDQADTADEVVTGVPR